MKTVETVLFFRVVVARTLMNQGVNGLFTIRRLIKIHNSELLLTLQFIAMPSVLMLEVLNRFNLSALGMTVFNIQTVETVLFWGE
jgi:hypothetical protein